MLDFISRLPKGGKSQSTYFPSQLAKEYITWTVGTMRPAPRLEDVQVTLSGSMQLAAAEDNSLQPLSYNDSKAYKAAGGTPQYLEIKGNTKGSTWTLGYLMDALEELDSSHFQKGSGLTMFSPAAVERIVKHFSYCYEQLCQGNPDFELYEGRFLKGHNILVNFTDTADGKGLVLPVDLIESQGSAKAIKPLSAKAFVCYGGVFTVTTVNGSSDYEDDSFAGIPIGGGPSGQPPVEPTTQSAPPAPKHQAPAPATKTDSIPW